HGSTSILAPGPVAGGWEAAVVRSRRSGRRRGHRASLPGRGLGRTVVPEPAQAGLAGVQAHSRGPSGRRGLVARNATTAAATRTAAARNHGAPGIHDRLEAKVAANTPGPSRL